MDSRRSEDAATFLLPWQQVQNALVAAIGDLGYEQTAMSIEPFRGGLGDIPVGPDFMFRDLVCTLHFAVPGGLLGARRTLSALLFHNKAGLTLLSVERLGYSKRVGQGWIVDPPYKKIARKILAEVAVRLE